LSGRALAWRDYYPFWKSRNERSRAGKLLLLDTTDEDTMQIFFDDNIGHGSAHIVDVRDVADGSSIAFQARDLWCLIFPEPWDLLWTLPARTSGMCRLLWTAARSRRCSGSLKSNWANTVRLGARK
jgi:hypothetical protein